MNKYLSVKSYFKYAKGKLKQLEDHIFSPGYSISKKVFIFKWFKPNSSKIGSFIDVYFKNDVLGPIQKDEAFFLFGLTRTMAPKTIVEFGFGNGHSAMVFLEAGGDFCSVYSFEPAPYSYNKGIKRFQRKKNFHLFNDSMENFSPTKINNAKIDIVFFDGAHDLRINQVTFLKILPSLTSESIIIIHDTNLWTEEFMNLDQWKFIKSNGIKKLEGGFAHRIEERVFSNWITTEFPDFRPFHLHTSKKLRHGFSIFQKTSGILNV